LIRWLAVALLILSASTQADAEPVQVVQITSDSLVVEHQKNLAQFDQHVWLKRGDFELRCDRLIVHYRQEMGGEVELAEAYGHVTMQQADKKGSSREARYQQAKAKLTLIGDAMVEGPEGLVQGEKILHDINTTHTTVLQGRDGERARFTIEEEDLNRMDKSTKPETGKANP
jgi:lipopolysaccharide export system protein LptA